MARLFAVTWHNDEGTDAVTLVEAERPQEAKERVLKAYHAIDMDMLTIENLTVNDIGSGYAEVYYMKPEGDVFYDVAGLGGGD